MRAAGVDSLKQVIGATLLCCDEGLEVEILLKWNRQQEGNDGREAKRHSRGRRLWKVNPMSVTSMK